MCITGRRGSVENSRKTRDQLTAFDHHKFVRRSKKQEAQLIGERSWTETSTRIDKAMHLRTFARTRATDIKESTISTKCKYEKNVITKDNNTSQNDRWDQ